jgi:hypothetical protein
VSRAFPSWDRSILTEIYRCHDCSYHEIEDGHARTGCERSPRLAAAQTPSAAVVAVSHLYACIGSPCLRHCVHGASIGAAGQQGGPGKRTIGEAEEARQQILRAYSTVWVGHIPLCGVPPPQPGADQQQQRQQQQQHAMAAEEGGGGGRLEAALASALEPFGVLWSVTVRRKPASRPAGAAPSLWQHMQRRARRRRFHLVCGPFGLRFTYATPVLVTRC